MRLQIIKSPRFRRDHGYFPPLALGYLYSFLKMKGFDVRQSDLNMIRHHQKKKKISGDAYRLRLVKLFSGHKFIKYLSGEGDKKCNTLGTDYLKGLGLREADVLLISVISLDYCSSMMALLMARCFKSKNKKGIVVIGGESFQRPYIDIDFEKYAKTGAFDYYILGPGEEPLYKLLQKCLGRDIDLKDIPGLRYYEDHKTVVNDPRPKHLLLTPEFTGLPLKDYAWHGASFFHKVSKKIFPLSGVLILPFQMIYGCPYRCAFCSSTYFPRKRILHMDPQKAVTALKILSEKYRTRYFLFLHDTFNFSVDFVDSFCDALIKANLRIQWADCANVRNIDNPDLLFKMRAAGACRLFFGLETASPSLQSYIHKNINCDHASKVLRWSHEAGIWTGLEIIAGFPYEKKEDVERTADFIVDNAPYLDVVALNSFYIHSHSYMKHRPQDYRLAHIRECDSPLDSIIDDHEEFRYAFDEQDGLFWHVKKKQIALSRTMLDRTITRCRLKPQHLKNELNVLFYLYTYLKDKEKIKSLFKLYRDQAEAVD